MQVPTCPAKMADTLQRPQRHVKERTIFGVWFFSVKQRGTADSSALQLLAGPGPANCRTGAALQARSIFRRSHLLAAETLRPGLGGLAPRRDAARAVWEKGSQGRRLLPAARGR